MYTKKDLKLFQNHQTAVLGHLRVQQSTMDILKVTTNISILDQGKEENATRICQRYSPSYGALRRICNVAKISRIQDVHEQTPQGCSIKGNVESQVKRAVSFEH